LFTRDYLQVSRQNLGALPQLMSDAFDLLFIRLHEWLHGDQSIDATTKMECQCELNTHTLKMQQDYFVVHA